jgi:hypothetical protein
MAVKSADLFASVAGSTTANRHTSRARTNRCGWRR